MLSFLFWNIGRKNVTESILDLATEHDIDVIVLVESRIPQDYFLFRASQRGRTFSFPEKDNRGLSVFTRFADRHWISQFDSSNSRVWIRRLALPGKPELLLVVAHLPSRREFDPDDISLECVKLGSTIREQEAKVGHSRTILLGDLNADPFDPGMVQTLGMHGVMTRNIARGGSRKVRGERYPFFYNPMWSHFGDRHDGAPGTYYYRSAKHTTYFWHLFDQALLRPDLLKYFDHSRLRILTEAAGNTLLTPSGIPDRNASSDHLPVLLQLSL